jgi:hypothetical protein
MGVVYVTVAPQRPASLLTTMGSGQAVEPREPSILGFSASTTVTVKLHEAVRPA